jgi:hypothetical protein
LFFFSHKISHAFVFAISFQPDSGDGLQAEHGVDTQDRAPVCAEAGQYTEANLEPILDDYI